MRLHLFFPFFRGVLRFFFSVLRASFALACLFMLFYPADRLFAYTFHNDATFCLESEANRDAQQRCTAAGLGPCVYGYSYLNSVEWHVRSYADPDGSTRSYMSSFKLLTVCDSGPNLDCACCMRKISDGETSLSLPEECDDCSPSTFSLTVSGSGHVTGNACGDEIFCPGGGCSGNSDPECACYVSITTHPNIETGNVSIECDSEYCSVSGKSASCIIGDEDGGESAHCSVKFGDLCTDDTDGDTIPDYVDPSPDEDNKLDIFEFEVFGFGASATFNVSDFYEWLSESLSNPTYEGGPFGTAEVRFIELCKKEGYKSPGCLRYGKPVSDGVEIKCDPKFEYCGSIPASLLSKLFPCEPGKLPDFSDLKPPSDIPPLPDIPDGVYTPDEGLSPDCQCFDIVNKNTAATVDMLKELHKVGGVINDNISLVVENTGKISEIMDDIKDDVSSISDNMDDINQGVSDISDSMGDIIESIDSLPDNIIDELNDDASRLSFSDEFDLSADDLVVFTSDDQAEIESLAESEKENFKQQLTSFNTQLMNDFKGRFQITSASEQCSFSAPVWGQNLVFNACDYASTLDVMGGFAVFLSYCASVFIILKA